MNQNTKASIHRLGKTLTLICRVTRLVFLLLASLSALGSVISIAAPELIDRYQDFIRQNTIFLLLEQLADLKSMDVKYTAAIGCAISALTFFTLSFYTRGFQELLLALIDSEKPFTREIAQTIRRKSYAVLLTVLYNPLVGIVIFLIAMLFSYLVDYGAYIQEKADQTNRIQKEMIVSFAEITENKSGQTGQHIRRVSEYTRIIAQEMGMTAEQAENLQLASTMHDIGKLLVPSEILEKPGKLTDEEYAAMKKHTTYGGELLENVEGEVMGTARTVALEHHERPDGKGYPAGKTDISLEGRIVAVADVYDALTSKRSYKEAWDEDRAYQEILKGSGTQFDPQVVEAFRRGYGKISEIRERYRD